MQWRVSERGTTMLRRPHDNNVERAGRLLEQNRKLVEGTIIDWLARIGQWDPEADSRIQKWLETQRQARATQTPEAHPPQTEQPA